MKIWTRTVARWYHAAWAPLPWGLQTTASARLGPSWEPNSWGWDSIHSHMCVDTPSLDICLSPIASFAYGTRYMSDSGDLGHSLLLMLLVAPPPTFSSSLYLLLSLGSLLLPNSSLSPSAVVLLFPYLYSYSCCVGMTLLYLQAHPSPLHSNPLSIGTQRKCSRLGKVFVSVSVSVFTCSRMHKCVSIFMCKPGSIIRYLLQSLSLSTLFFFFATVLVFLIKHRAHPGWLARKLQESFCLSFPNTVTIGRYHHVCLFM